MRRSSAKKLNAGLEADGAAGGRRRNGLMRIPGLRHQRELRCWTVAELARRAGVKWPTAAIADSGEEVSPDTARKILLALEASPPSEIAMRLFGAGALATAENDAHGGR